MNKNIFTALLVASAISPALAQFKTLKVASPNQALVFTLSIHGDQPKYAVMRSGKPVIEASALGLTVNDKDLSTADSFTEVSTKAVNETYKTRGVHSVAVDKYNEAVVKVNGARPYQLDIKVFDDGVAFRYIVANKGEAKVNADLTAFTIPLGSTIWSQGDVNAYEGKYLEQKIETVKKGLLAGPPLTIKLSGGAGYAALTEGGLTDFAGMSLLSQGNRRFVANLYGITHKNGVVETPWRIILSGSNLNTLVNSDIIGNVSPQPDANLFPKGNDTYWIKPGKSVWSWLAGNGEVTFENMKRYADWAGDLGFDYNLVDEGWSKWQDGKKDKWDLMKELVDYSAKKGVKVWAWKAYPDRVGDPGIKDPEARMAFFKQCKAIGITGLKIDFFDAESQEVMDFYQDALRDAASLHLMLDFHGADKPTGQSRTWPNEMSREGIRGLENGTAWAKHNNTLIFTRYLAGHGDYTPLSLRDIVKGTTLTHQVATVAAFTSPFMCLAVDPQVLLKSEVKTMVRQIPVVWDETVILPQSTIGDLTVMARRSGTVWFLVALNGEKARSVKVDLSFLGQGAYHSNTLEDMASNPAKTILKSKVYSKANTLLLNMPAGGGFIGRFHK